MNIISLGSNCDVSLMIQNHINNYIPNSILYNHLFTWSAIKINDINHFLRNLDLLIDSNFKQIYRLLRNFDGSNFSRNKIGYYDLNEFLKDIENNSDADSVHIDIDFKYEDINFWTHGISMSINEFNKDKNEEYINCIKSKKDHLVDKFLNVLNNQEPKLFCIKCLAGEYSLQDIIDLNNLLLKYSAQNYIAIVVEEDKNIDLNNLNLKNTCIVISPRLTSHQGIDLYYEQLFEKARIILNL
jgi:hypothetical protein